MAVFAELVASFDADAGKRGAASVSALYLDQPFGRQLDLLRLALPQARRKEGVKHPARHLGRHAQPIVTETQLHTLGVQPLRPLARQRLWRG